jgi:asparagine synthase (glutamine-hydrolysing)
MKPALNELCLGHPEFPLAAPKNQEAEDGATWRQVYDTVGVKAPAQVTGDFAVAFRTPDDGVFMAVDRFAIRSLCYRQVGKTLLFAERADELADSSSEIDPQAIFDYFYFHCIPSPRTIFKGIFRVPPAHYVSFERGVLTVAPYWVPAFEERKGASFETLRGEFLELLQTATATQLDGSKPACFLSGGTDSSTVAGMISRVAGEVSTYSIGFAAEGYDEMGFARIAAQRFKTDHHEYYVTPDDLVRNIPKVAAHYDQPFGNSSALPAFSCAQMARDDGVSKILAGDGGDELFGGNSRYAKQRLFNWYQSFPGLLRRGLMEPVLDTPLAARLPGIRKASSYVEQARVPMPDRLQMYNLIMRLEVDRVFTPDFLSRVDLSTPLRHQQETWHQPVAHSATNRELAYDWRYTLAESDLPKVCGTTRLAGLGVGFPLLDTQLLEFSMRLPTSYKLKGLKLRWFFKEALRGFLPDEIITKKKQGFGLPFGVWLTKNVGLRRLAEESVRGLADRGVFQHAFVDVLFDSHLKTHPGYYGEMVWISMMLEQWLRSKFSGFSIE